MFDTSVLVPALVEQHPNHIAAVDLLNRAHAGEFPWFIGAHSLAECYATLTARVKPFGIPPLVVAQTLNAGLLSSSATIVELSWTDYQRTIEKVANLGLSSGTIYDALLATAAQKAAIERLYTFNLKRFLQVWPEGSTIITVP